MTSGTDWYHFNMFYSNFFPIVKSEENHCFVNFSHCETIYFPLEHSWMCFAACILIRGKFIHSFKTFFKWSMVPTGKESLKKSFVVYVRQTQYMLVGKMLPQFSAPEKPLVVTPEDYPELRPILPQSSRLELYKSTCSRLWVKIQS